MRAVLVLIVAALVLSETMVSGAGPSFCYRRLEHCLGKTINSRPRSVARAVMQKKCWSELAECLKHL
ncbi:hypothetical protein ScPMuIL_015320 [Solemya velum]